MGSNDEQPGPCHSIRVCICVCACVGACAHSAYIWVEGVRVVLLLKPSIIPAFTSVSSDRRLGDPPSLSRHCLAMGPTIV